MSKKYYKVLYIDQLGNLTSCIKNPSFFGGQKFKDKYSLEYRIGEWTKPKVEKTDLMCFSDLRSAHNFVIRNFFTSRFNHVCIYECKVRSPRQQGLYTPLDTYSLEWKIQQLIKARRHKKKIRNQLQVCPHSNTVFCSAIKLTDRVG